MELGLEPLRGPAMLTLGTVAIAAGVVDTVLPVTALAVIEAVSIMSALAVWDGTDGLVVGERSMGVALEDAGAKALNISPMVVMRRAPASES